MKKNLIYLIINILYVSTCLAQQDSVQFKFIRSFAIEANNLQTDEQGNIYVINNNELKKYNSEGLFLNSFSTKNNYNITSINVSNPIKILLFIKETNKIIFLNKTLNIINTMFLYNYDIYSPQFVCSSVRNGFYVYDNSEYSLFFISNNKNEQIKIDFFNNKFELNYIQENNNKLYLNYPDTGIIVLDNLFFEEDFIPLKKTKNVQIKEKNISYLNTTNSEITFYNYKKKYIYNLNLPIKNVNDAKIEQNLIFILNKNQIFIYQFWKIR